MRGDWMRSRWWGVALTLATLAAIGYAAWSAPTAKAPAADPATASQSTPTPTSPSESPVEEITESTFDLTAHSRRDAGSLWMLVDKQRALPATYEPEWDIVEGYRVDERAVQGLQRLLGEARAGGMDLRIMSAFRSYSHQSALYDDRVAAIGAEAAARVTAPPGHSEHQTGLAIDFGRATTGECNVEPCFARTPEGRWLRQHAAKFGFVLRYPAGAESITGYDPESWHYRFVGRALATHLRDEGIRTLEEAFAGVGAGG